MSRWITNRTFFETFRKTVATAGTAEKLHSDLPIPDGFQLIIKALDGNTGDVEYASSQAKAQGTNAFILDSGQSVGLRITNANLVWIDVTVNAEGVVCSVEQY